MRCSWPALCSFLFFSSKFLCSVLEISRKQNGRVSVRQIEKKCKSGPRAVFGCSPLLPPSPLLLPPSCSSLPFLPTSSLLSPLLPPSLLPSSLISPPSLLPPPPFAVPLPSLSSSLFAFPVPFSIRFLPEEKELFFLLLNKKAAQRKHLLKARSPGRSRKVPEGFPEVFPEGYL